jgi:hypothetical protein
MYILIKSASEKRERIPILQYSERSVSDKFYKAIFSTIKISDVSKAEFITIFERQQAQDTKPVIKSFKDPDLQVSFNFLIELNRIISELQHPGYMGENSKKSITGISRASRFGTGLITVPVRSLITRPISYIISDTKLQYEELLREYTLMTGNFLMLTSSFILDKSKLDKGETERVNNELTETLNKLESSIAILTNDIAKGAQRVEETASMLATDSGAVGEEPQRGSREDTEGGHEGDSKAGPEEGPQRAPEGGRSLSKKKYNYSQKRKTKRNKRKRRAF